MAYEQIRRAQNLIDHCDQRWCFIGYSLFIPFSVLASSDGVSRLTAIATKSHTQRCSENRNMPRGKRQCLKLHTRLLRATTSSHLSTGLLLHSIVRCFFKSSSLSIGYKVRPTHPLCKPESTFRHLLQDLGYHRTGPDK